MQNWRVLVPVLLVALTRPLLAVETVDNLIDRYLKAVDGIRSYDVTMRVEQLAYPDLHDLTKAENTPVVAITEDVRDAFAVGLGRRVERSVEDKESHSISLIDWKSATGTGRPLPKALAAALPGAMYRDYFNPDIWGFFLTELVRNKASNVRLLEPAPSVELVGFEVNHSRLYGPVRVWLDPKHGYMPDRIEIYQRTDGKVGLADLARVVEYVQAEGQMWVPAKTMWTSMAPTGPTAGRAHLGFRIVVDQKRSSWNSIQSDKLFRAESLAAVNHEERGWKHYYPPARLPAVKASVEARRRPADPLGSSMLRLVLVTASVLGAVVIGAYTAWKRFARRSGAAL